MDLIVNFLIGSKPVNSLIIFSNFKSFKVLFGLSENYIFKKKKKRKKRHCP